MQSKPDSYLISSMLAWFFQLLHSIALGGRSDSSISPSKACVLLRRATLLESALQISPALWRWWQRVEVQHLKHILSMLSWCWRDLHLTRCWSRLGIPMPGQGAWWYVWATAASSVLVLILICRSRSFAGHSGTCASWGKFLRKPGLWKLSKLLKKLTTWRLRTCSSRKLRRRVLAEVWTSWLSANNLGEGSFPPSVGQILVVPILNSSAFMH